MAAASLMKTLRARNPAAANAGGLAAAAGLHPDGMSPDALLGGKPEEDEPKPGLAGEAKAQLKGPAALARVRARGVPSA